MDPTRRRGTPGIYTTQRAKKKGVSINDPGNKVAKQGINDNTTFYREILLDYSIPVDGEKTSLLLTLRSQITERDSVSLPFNVTPS